MEQRQTNIVTLLIKFLVLLFICWISFGLFDQNTFPWILVTTILATIIMYVFGDLFILPRYKTFTATLVDGAMGIILVVLLDWLSDSFNVRLQAILVFTILILIFEYIFHRFLQDDMD